MPDDYDYKMSEMEFKLFELKDQETQLNNTEAEITVILNEKADLMNPNIVHQQQLDFISLEAMLKKR